MDSSKVLMLGALGVGGYLAYRWYAGPGGYADQQACAAGGSAAGATSLAGIAVTAWVDAAANKYSSALDFIAANAAANPPSTVAAQAMLSCFRVAVTRYPSLALAQAAAGTETAAATTPAPATPTTATAAPANLAPVTVAPVAPAPVTNTLDSIYSALSAKASAAGVNASTGVAPGGNVGPDGWNYYLATVYTLPGGASVPDPNSVFPGVDRSQPMSLATYWASMAPWLGSHAGLSGLGLFGGLGAVVMRNRRAW